MKRQRAYPRADQFLAEQAIKNRGIVMSFHEEEEPA
jgi:hypothetical protein